MSGFTLLTDPFETKGFVQPEKYFARIKNFQEDPLIAYPEQSTLTFKPHVGANEAKLYMNIYKDCAGLGNGEPVGISCEIGDKNYLLCVASNSLILKEGVVPEKIPTEASEFIFYQRNFLDKYRTYESSLKSGFFLAFNEEDWNLILKPYHKDELDTNAAFLSRTSKQESFKVGLTQIPCYLLNNNNDLLIAHPEESIATFESDGQSKEEHAIFYQDIYRELALSDKGLPVALSCKVGDKNYHLCAANNSVILKEGELPKEIPETTSELIFYRKQFSDGHSSCRFESSLKQNNFLAWNTEDPKRKMILKPNAEDVIDETMKFDLEDKSENMSAM